VAAAGLLLALILLFFNRIALTNQVLPGLDLFAYFYPYRDYASEALRAGRLPLWNPYLFMGAPFLANSQVAVLYPLHWPLLWLSAPKQIAWSIVAHLWIAGLGTYLFAKRAVGLRPLPAFVASVVFALGGFLSAQVEHVNQLNASAWLPWLLLAVHGSVTSMRWRRYILAGSAVVGLTLLAGHTQAAYIVFCAAGVYALARSLPHLMNRHWPRALGGLGSLVAMVLGGGSLAAAQLLPTLELSRLSVRSGGLPYNEAGSFSLKPWLIFKALLPPLLWDPPFSEYIAYVGLLGVGLAIVGVWVILRGKRPGAEAIVLAVLGVFLAFGAYNPAYYVLYKLVPGFDLFRAPARWLLLFSFAAALLAGIGLEALRRLGRGRQALLWAGAVANRPGAPVMPPRRGTTLWQSGLALLLVLELFVAGRHLAYNHPTAPAAFDSMRSAPAHLLADASEEPFRFLSMSDTGYDPGDLADLQALYGTQLPESARYDLVVATKMKEVLAFNLPLLFRLHSVDGYDGGLLPIKDYVALERLFLADDEIWPDGRLRQQLGEIPPSRLISLLNVKYVITDKTQDAWIDGIYYDLQHTTSLGAVRLGDLPGFESTHLGVVSYLTGAADLLDGTPVARITVSGTDGVDTTVLLRAGDHTAEGAYEERAVAHRRAAVAHHWSDHRNGYDYVALLDLERKLVPRSVGIESLLPDGKVQLRGLSLVDARTDTSRTLSVSSAYRLVHSGDVKIYQNLAVLPRAFVVHRARVLTDHDSILALLSGSSFDPSLEVVLGEGQELVAEGGQTEIEILAYEPEIIRARAQLETPGYLVLADAYYPGWVAEVDGRPVSVHRANLYFRAIGLEAGQHEITFRYQPDSVQVGLAMSLGALLVWVVLCAVESRGIGRNGPSDV
jgi:hypothetical protein